MQIPGKFLRLSLLLCGLANARVLFAQTPVTLLGFQTTAPAGWVTRAPSSSMRLAEYVLPGAEVVVYFFGQGQGGDANANITRWKSQFSTPDGSPVPLAVTRDSVPNVRITFAELRGTYSRGIGMGSSVDARTGQTLMAAIAETPRGTMFVQLFGPSPIVAAQRPAFIAFVKGLKE